ncbi:hypothetical protein FHX42_003924 [Saccharopolyspora lacisalsi]|uniref:DUF4244 domain-containing protein n=1 Tax=Halosaccharopolyspora lacisalsi TaxID=1000566 RepID=A0A839E420_9PSEU|nr:DUF4244 domain-containing protein [Halosaccharopolyspora lacisalsi]MBA8826545.1 hypothetical protein [Halosaccharopolyspora lacisalsi]
MIFSTATVEVFSARLGRWLRDRALWARIRPLLRDEGTSTAEYAIGTLSAAALASVLYVVVTSDAVTDALTSLIQRALEVRF